MRCVWVVLTLLLLTPAAWAGTDCGIGNDFTNPGKAHPTCEPARAGGNTGGVGNTASDNTRISSLGADPTPVPEPAPLLLLALGLLGLASSRWRQGRGK